MGHWLGLATDRVTKLRAIRVEGGVTAAGQGYRLAGLRKIRLREVDSVVEPH